MVSIASVAWFVGCSNNNSSSGGAISYNCSYVNGACVDSYGNIISNGVVATSRVQYYDNQFYFSFDTGQYSPSIRGNMTIVNAGAYQQFLKEAMVVCDQASMWNWGGNSCSTWLQGSLQVSFYIDSSMKPYIDFRAVPGQSWYSGSAGFYTGGATLNPLQLYNNTTFNLINNSKGFELRSNGSYWNGGGLKLIQIQVDTGTLNDASFNYKLIYPYNGVATTFATGVFKRY